MATASTSTTSYNPQPTQSRRQIGTTTPASSLSAIIFAADRSTTAASTVASANQCESAASVSTCSNYTLSSTSQSGFVKPSSSAWSSRHYFDLLQNNQSKDRCGSELSTRDFGFGGSSTPSSAVQQRLPESGERVYSQEVRQQHLRTRRRCSTLVQVHPSIAIC
ncbi:hypothetical protein BGZ72_004526 [Mortierella alpina]|nr:hypothetical protein BGZ72_004526 [Mortierella alpina]